MKRIPIDERKHRTDGTEWVLLKALLNAQKGLALAINISDRCMGGYEVHILLRQTYRERILRLPDGTEKKIVNKEKWLWRRDEDFGKYAWAYRSLEQIYRDFPEFKKYQTEIIKKRNTILKEIE